MFSGVGDWTPAVLMFMLVVMPALTPHLLSLVVPSLVD
jgi:hypothetical protein